MSGAMKRIAVDSAQGGVLSSRRASFGRVDMHDTHWLSPVDCTMGARKNSFNQMLSRNCLTPQEPVNPMVTPSSPMPIRRSRLSSWVKESPYLLHVRKDSIQHHRDASPIYQRFPESPRNTNGITTIFSPLACRSPIKFDLPVEDDSPGPSSPISVIKRGRSKSIIEIVPNTYHRKSKDSKDAIIPEQKDISFQCLSPCCANKDEGFLFHFDTEGFSLSQNEVENSLHEDDDNKNINNNDINTSSNYDSKKRKDKYINRIFRRNSSISNNINSNEKDLNLIYSTEDLVKKENKSPKKIEKVDKRKFCDDLDNTPTKIPKIFIKSPADEKDGDIIGSPSKLMSSYSNRGFSSVLMSVTKGNSPIGTNLSYLMKTPMNPPSHKKTNLQTHRRGSLQPHLLHTPIEKAMTVSYKFPHAGVLGLGVQHNHSGSKETLCLSPQKKRQSICPSSLSKLQPKVWGLQFQDDISKYTLTLKDKIKAINKGFQPKIGCVLGRGGFGVVKMGLYDGKFVAIKIIHGSRAATSACHEKFALGIPPHPHVVSTHAFVKSISRDTAKIYWKTEKRQENVTEISREELKSWFSLPLESVTDASFSSLSKGSEWLWIVSELCSPLTLQSLINMSNLKFTVRDKIKLLGQMTSGVAHLHNMGLNHLDLKPSNALISYDGKVKIADFGCCSPSNDHMGEPVIGTVAYQAPEVLIGGCGTNASDIFSLGVTIWHLVIGKFPYYGIHPHVVLYQVTRLNQRPNSLLCFSPRPTSLLEDLLLRIAERCWTTDPKARPTAQAVCRSLAALYLSAAM